MERLAALTWGPWLVFGLPLVALLLWWTGRRRRLRGGDTAAGSLAYGRRVLAAGAGLGSMGATIVSMELAGPGAVAWMWLGLLLGLPLVRIEARLATSTSPPPRPARSLRMLAFLVAGVAIAGLLQSRQLALIWQEEFHQPAWGASAPILALLAAGLVPAARRRLLALAPAGFALFVAVAALALLQIPGAITGGLATIARHALDYRPVAAGLAGAGLTLGMVHGMARAVVAGPIALGAVSEANPAPLRAAVAARAATRAAVGSALGVSTLAALLGLAQLPDEPVVAERLMLPMERAESRGLRPNPDVGQTVVLPEDTALEPGKAYPMVLRANPRGHAFFQARYVKERNVVVVPAFGVLANLDTVVFRAKHRQRAKNPAWDARVPVVRKEVEFRGVTLYELAPADPDLDLGRMITRRALDDTPFLVADDFHFLGQVARAVAPDELGEHLAMFERRPQGAPPNPAFHEFFRIGFRGPYPDSGQPRPPWALVGIEGFDAPAGTLLDLELRAPPRGSNLLAITQRGDLEAPPWSFLLGAREVVLRHEEGPEHDIYVPVVGEVKEGRLRFRSAIPQWRDFRVVNRMEHLSGPFLRAPSYRFQAEVRGGARLPAARRGRRALVPLHPHGEPLGPHEALPYDPHPGEVLTTDMLGPVPARRSGAAAAAYTVAGALGTFGAAWFLLAATLLLAGNLAAWMPDGGGRRGAITALALAAGALAGPRMGTHDALWLADAMVGLAAALGVVAIWLHLRVQPRAR